MSTIKIKQEGSLEYALDRGYVAKVDTKKCINCGTCTAICPAAEFYRYDPRKIVDTVQRKDDAEIEALVSADVSGKADAEEDALAQKLKSLNSQLQGVKE